MIERLLPELQASGDFSLREPVDDRHPQHERPTLLSARRGCAALAGELLQGHAETANNPLPVDGRLNRVIDRYACALKGPRGHQAFAVTAAKRLSNDVLDGRFQECPKLCGGEGRLQVQ